MSQPLSRLATRAAYGARQLSRVAWYVGHSVAMRRLSEEARRRDGESTRPRDHTDAAVPDRRRLFADMATLLQQDLANVEAGIYPLPVDHDGSLSTLLNRSRLFFEDLPDTYRRRESGEHSEVLTDWELQVPTHRPKDHVSREMTASELILDLVHRRHPAPWRQS